MSTWLIEKLYNSVCHHRFDAAGWVHCNILIFSIGIKIFTIPISIPLHMR